MQTIHWLMLTVGAPMLGFLAPVAALRSRPVATARWAVACSGLSLLGALGMLFTLPTETVVIRHEWLVSGDFRLEFGFLVDGLSAIAALVVALVTFCVQLYSLGYMAHDPGRMRYFSFICFFAWTMLSFVLAINLLQVFIFWELVGLASFFLIGFWFEKPSAMMAARKAFLMTRIGDVGLFVGIVLLLKAADTYDLPALLDPESGALALMSPRELTVALLLIFMGVVGKSAQLPLHTWLPDAMEGPTPVSALLHSATMVAAGVLLLARLHPLLAASPAAAEVVLWVAVATALVSATMAMVARDIKRVLAYSSIGQLAYMLMGLAAGSLFVGVFHLTTHAFFKALLFLCAGAYIHRFGSNDLLVIGRKGGRSMRVTTAGLIIGGAALAGIPPLAGFFSKEHIFGVMHEAHRNGFLIAALAAAFLTAYYTFRMVFLVVRPNPASAATVPDEAPGAHAHHDDGHHGPDGPWVMWAPILILTVATVITGFAGHWFAELLHEEAGAMHLALTAGAVTVALAGVALAWFDFGRAAAPQTGFIARIPALQTLFEKKWFFDHIYEGIVGGITWSVARIAHFLETKGLDGAYHLFGVGMRGAGLQTGRLQTGMMQIYVGSTIIILTLFIGIVGLG